MLNIIASLWSEMVAIMWIYYILFFGVCLYVLFRPTPKKQKREPAPPQAITKTCANCYGFFLSEKMTTIESGQQLCPACLNVLHNSTTSPIPSICDSCFAEYHEANLKTIDSGQKLCPRCLDAIKRESLTT